MFRSSGLVMPLVILAALVLVGAPSASPLRETSAARVPSGSILFWSDKPRTVGQKWSYPAAAYAVSARGGNTLREILADALDAHWSPDGESIAYARRAGSGTREYPVGLFVMRADGTRKRLVASVTGPLRGEFSWSADSKRLAVATTEGMYVINTKRAQKHSLGYFGYSPVWSPDDGRIAYTRPYARNRQSLFTVDADGRNHRLLTSTMATTDVLPLSPQAWSPDGRRLAFDMSGGGGISVVDVANGKTRHYGSAERLGVPSWAPNGRWIAATAWFRGGTYLVRPSDGRTVKLSDLGNGEAPTWSPDSGALAVTQICCNLAASDIWTVAVPGGTAQKITQSSRYGYSVTRPAWGPAGLQARKLPGRNVSWEIPTDSVHQAGLLKTGSPIRRLAADGDAVAVEFAGDCVFTDVWRPLSRAVLRLPRCGRVALAGEQVVWTWGPGIRGNGENWYVYASTLARPRANELSRDWDPYRPLGEPMGDDGLAAFALWGKCSIRAGECTSNRKRPGELFRLDDERLIQVATSPFAMTVASVDNGRILVDHENGELDLLRPDGSVIRTFRLNADVVRGVRLQGRDLVVLTTSAVEVTNSETGAFVRRWPLPAANASLADVDSGVAVLVRGDQITLLRLSDGRAAVFETPSAIDVSAQLEPSGLFYSYRADDPTHPGRVRFVPFEQIRFGDG